MSEQISTIQRILNKKQNPRYRASSGFSSGLNYVFDSDHRPSFIEKKDESGEWQCQRETLTINSGETAWSPSERNNYLYKDGFRFWKEEALKESTVHVETIFDPSFNARLEKARNNKVLWKFRTSKKPPVGADITVKLKKNGTRRGIVEKVTKLGKNKYRVHLRTEKTEAQKKASIMAFSDNLYANTRDKYSDDNLKTNTTKKSDNDNLNGFESSLNDLVNKFNAGRK